MLAAKSYKMQSASDDNIFPGKDVKKAARLNNMFVWSTGTFFCSKQSCTSSLVAKKRLRKSITKNPKLFP